MVKVKQLNVDQPSRKQFLQKTAKTRLHSNAQSSSQTWNTLTSRSNVIRRGRNRAPFDLQFSYRKIKIEKSGPKIYCSKCFNKLIMDPD